jgi:hypothetical protein
MRNKVSERLHEQRRPPSMPGCHHLRSTGRGCGVLACRNHSVRNTERKPSERADRRRCQFPPSIPLLRSAQALPRWLLVAVDTGFWTIRARMRWRSRSLNRAEGETQLAYVARPFSCSTSIDSRCDWSGVIHQLEPRRTIVTMWKRCPVWGRIDCHKIAPTRPSLSGRITTGRRCRGSDSRIQPPLSC